jgi:hypothetical protein
MPWRSSADSTSWCCAGAVGFGPASEPSVAVTSALFDANAVVPISLARAAAPALAPGGVITTISGIVADHPTAGPGDVLRELDVRPPHAELGLNGRPLEGVAPRLAADRDPGAVAAALVDALVRDADKLACYACAPAGGMAIAWAAPIRSSPDSSGYQQAT